MKAGWKTVQLTDVAELSGRIGWKGLTAREYTRAGPYFLSVHSLNYGDFVDFRDSFHISQARYDESPEIMLQAGDVLICKDGAGIGKVGIVGELPGQTTINSSLLLIRATPKIETKYLYYILMSPYFQAIVQSRLEGATTPHLYQRDISRFPIHLPPLNEQRRIVAVLDKAFAGIATATANAQKNLTNARSLFDDFLSSKFGDGASDWPATTIADACTLRSGTTVNANLEQPSGDIPYLKVADMSHPANLEEVTSSSRFLRKCDIGKNALIPAGATIFPKRGGAIMTNKKRLTTVPIAADLNIMAAIPGSSILPRFLRFYFENVDMKKLGSGSSIPQINNYDIEPLVIHVPTKPVQARFVEQADALKQATTDLERANRQKLAALTELKQSLLQKAFAGELT